MLYDEHMKLPDNKTDLLELKLNVQAQGAMLKEQVQESKDNFREFGEESEPDWYRRIMHAIRVNGRLQQRIALQITKLNEEKKKQSIEDTHEFEQLFKSSAKLILDSETYQEILELAKDMRSELKADPTLHAPDLIREMRHRIGD